MLITNAVSRFLYRMLILCKCCSFKKRSKVSVAIAHCKKYGGYTHHVGGIIPPSALPTMVGLSSWREPTKIRGILTLALMVSMYVRMC